MTDHIVVVDLGGTTLRIGRYRPGSGQVTDVRRMPVDGLDPNPGESATRLQQRVLRQLGRELKDESPDSPVGIAFAGPVTADGTVTGAPTVWGSGGPPLALARTLEAALDRPVLVVNDITAAAWRYARTETEPFCLITVSSGIGNKVFRDGRVLVDPAGYGGELGHWRVDPSPDAPRCDCGGRGHLGALASGRGILAAARRGAVEDPAAFAGSGLALRCAGEPALIDNPTLVAAAVAGDRFTIGILQNALRHLAAAVTAVYSAIGVRRYPVIGGFAQAVGELFVRLLTEQLLELGCFGLGDQQIRRMVSLGYADDDHGLIGVGHLLERRLAGTDRAAGPAGPAAPERTE